MKQIIKLYTLLFLIIGAIFCSCVDEDIVHGKKYNIAEGIPVEVSLGFGVTKSDIVTSRAAATEDQEKRVNDLFVIAFNHVGQLSSYRTENGEMIMGGIYYPDVNSSAIRGEISNFTMHSGEGQTIYAIANASTGYTDLDPDKLQAFDGTEEDFLGLTAKLQNSYSTQISRTSFVMSGMLKNVAVTEKGTILEPTSPTVPLDRLEARIRFDIKVAKGKTFTPRYYQVKRIPQGTYLIPRAKSDYENEVWDYTEGGYADMNSTNQIDFTTTDEGVSFEFYVWENRLTPRQNIEESDKLEDIQNLYALREKRDQVELAEEDKKNGQEYTLGDFTYANANSTYVVIYGTLSYQEENDGKEERITADVRYTIHLGNTGNSNANPDWTNEPTLVNDYDTERNTHYIYTVTLTGVKSMGVEVQQDKEVRPGVEGDVNITFEEHEMDSHYGRVLFKLNKADILTGLSWRVNTPFCSGNKIFNEDNYMIDGSVPEDETKLETVDALKTTLSLNDYRWIQFVINAEAIKKGGDAVPSDEFAKYPGYKAYSGGSGANTQAPAFGGNGYHWPSAEEENGSGYQYYDKNVKLYDVNQLLNHLYVAAMNNSEIFDEVTGDVAITAFIDEYVYSYDPRKTYYCEPKSTTDENLTLWKETVNNEFGNRTLSIFGTEETTYSPDGNTSWTGTNITFLQRPIYTFYNPEKTETAWGTESEVETGELSTSAPNPWLNQNSTSNGRENTVEMLTSNSAKRQWSKILDMRKSAWGILQKGYQTMWYACLGRNRDLNGNDYVDEDEIRWYIASIDQLTDLWIGEAALPTVARLYDTSKYVNGNIVTPHHVASSSLNSDQNDNVWIIWAEEGASRGGRSGSQGTNGSEYDYRCVRNLGISLDNLATETPESYVEITSGTYTVGSGQNRASYNEYVMDLSKLDGSVLRAGSGNTVLGKHFERDNTNRTNYPSQKIAVIRSNSYNGKYKSGPIVWNSIVGEDNSPVCPSGYRLPNQRELMLLSIHFGYEQPDGEEWDNLFKAPGNAIWVSRTEYSFENYVRQDPGDKQTSYSGRSGFGYQLAEFDNQGQLTGPCTFLLLNSTSGTFYIRCVRDVIE